MMPIRVTINYKGRVQGVGFRWRVNHLALSCSCTGYVKNLPDGTVELLVEGESNEVYRFIAKVNVQLKEFWHDKTEDQRVGEANFTTFDIIY